MTLQKKQPAEAKSDSIKRKTPAPPYDFKVWYGKNKERLSKKKALRYQEDEAYRNSIILRSKLKRDLKRELKKKTLIDKPIQ